VFHRAAGLHREEECERILDSYGENFEAISAALDRQFSTIHNRAQVVLGICGILISASVLVTTGKLIAGPNLQNPRLPGLALVAAGILEVGAAAVVVGGVLRVRWITQQPGADVRSWVMATLAYRDRKTNVYHTAVSLVLLSMVAYQTAVTLALLQR
jgi:hypothetical protein